MFFAPRGHEAKDGAKALAMFGEGILDAGRHFGVDLAADDVVALELTKLLGQHFLRGPGEKPLQLAETADAPLQEPIVSVPMQYTERPLLRANG